MSWGVKFWKSSVGAKITMATTGVILVLFVLVHMAGNLLVFVGRNALNEYAVFLRSTHEVLWTVRIVLVVAVLLHIISAVRLWLLNNAARPRRYQVKGYLEAHLTGRTMILTGLVVLAFLVFHLLEFTFGAVHPQLFHVTDALGRHDVYTMVVSSFQQAPIALTYIIAMILLGFHLSHGVSSMFQSVGLRTPKTAGFVDKLGPLVATIIVIGNISMPIAVMTGFITLTHGGM